MRLWKCAASMNLWKAIHDKLLAPKVDEAEIDACLNRARQQLPVPVFWLLGKAQSGKTSLVRALTGSPRAQIGNGFKACTRTAHLYDFPDEGTCFLRFLDTRGLGEAEYDPADDMRVFEEQAHLLIVVVKAADHAPQCVLEPLAAVRRAHPRWPIIVLQTCLHELYPPGMGHITPYPFDSAELPACVPADLARSLAAQHEWFQGLDARFVPVDFTLPDDGLPPEHYGLEALWAAIEEALPLGLRAMLAETREARQPFRDAHFRAAHPHVLAYSIAAGGLAAGVFVPLVDMPLIVGIQLKLFHTIASIYGQKFSGQRAAEILSTLGAGLLARQGGRELLKLIPVPGLGAAVSAVYAAASTYALGRTLCAYFSYAFHGDVPDPKLLKALYREQLAEGRRRFGEYLRTRQDSLV